MMNYKKTTIETLNDNVVDALYKELLHNKYSFMLINYKNKHMVLTKEKSFFEIQDEKTFVEKYNQNKFYKTVIVNKDIKVNENDLKLYYKYLNMFKDKMLKNLYGDKYIFGSVAVKTDNGFITTIRGKENLNDYTVVLNVDNTINTVEVLNKKATLNAPLLFNMFQNKKVKIIVHINHEYDDSLEYYEYAFPGTTQDSFRKNIKSFNIKHHGLVYLFDSNGNLIR